MGTARDSGYTESLTIDVTPDGAAGCGATLPGSPLRTPPVTSSTAGDKSVYGCVVEGGVN